MSQSARVNDNGIDIFGTGLMNAIDQVTFVIALKAGKLAAGRFNLGFGGRNNIIQSRFSLNVAASDSGRSAEECFLPWLVKVAFNCIFSILPSNVVKRQGKTPEILKIILFQTECFE